ncbi:MAG TPA: PH domain-containing protein [Planctomycetota bacterium]|nr:PH domain-containing protein [Planctomycetota bacterium]
MAEPLRRLHPLRRRKIIKKSIGCAIGLLMLGGFTSLFVMLWLYGGLAREMPAWFVEHRDRLALVWFGMWGVLLLWNPIYQCFYFNSYFYDLNDRNIVIRKGVIARREITLPVSKITDVYVDQDIIDAMLCLYDVHISNPTQSSGQFAHIDGLNRCDSEKLKGLLLDRINASAAK